MRQEVVSFPPSFAQQRLWFLDQLQPSTPLYNVSATLPLNGPLHLAALEQSVDEIARRHEILRTTFPLVEGGPVQVVAPASHVPVRIVDLRAQYRSERDQEARRLITEESLRPFDLARGPLLRTTLLRLSEMEQLLLVTMHHIVSDGWSLGVFFRELAVLYQAYVAGQASPLPELSIQYADFATWQRERLQGGALDGLLSYWKQCLAGAPALLELPSDRPRPPVQSFRGSMQPFVLPDALSGALRALAQREGVTLFMAALASFEVLLHRYTGREDLIVGSPIANRGRRELEELIGFFVNTLVLRTDLGGNPSFREVLRRVREATVAAYSHQDLPFERLVEELQPERNLSHNPLFQVMFVLQNAPSALPGPVGVPEAPADVPPVPPEHSGVVAKFDLTLSMSETPHGLLGLFEYNTDLFDTATIARMARHFQVLLAGLVRNPEARLSDLPLLTEEERHELLVQWNDTEEHYPRDRCIHELFEAQVARTPDAIAVTFQGEQITYDRLNRQANQLAHHLRTLGVVPDMPVGLCAERSLEIVIGLLGILKAGAAYMPLDPQYPAERLAFMLADADVSVLLTQAPVRDRLSEPRARVVCLDTEQKQWAGASEQNPDAGVTASGLAYVIYTSGSTGRPKGVLLEHRGLCNVIQAQIRTWDVRPECRVLQFASLSFDASISETFMALASGARLCLAPSEALLPGPPLIRLLRNEGITTLTVSPSVLAALPVEPLPRLSTIVLAGEACPAEVVRRWAAGRRLFNAYGPTEATIWATGAECSNGTAPPPIGRPIPNMQAYVLDRHLAPVPMGVPGELHLGGVGLARGYLNQPRLTAEKFIANPFHGAPSARLYKTGDLVRYRPDGNLEFVGRIDDQVKMRGFRIELAEIEAVLTQHPAVQEAAVVVREDPPGDKRLVAYVAPVPGRTYSTGDLRKALRAKLPDYMMPAVFIPLAALPRTVNGKLDRRALPALDGRPPEDGPAPRTALERSIAAAWQEVLQVERVGLHDNFFDLGGHSLLVVRLHDRLRESLRRDLPLTELFRYPTVSSLAAYLCQDDASRPSLEHVHLRARKQREVIGRMQAARTDRKSL
jgi:amino acid adenylation domain-containing protein